MTHRRLIGLVLVLALVSAGCSTIQGWFGTPVSKTVEVSGTTLVAIGNQFVNVSGAFKTGCDQGTIQPTQCTAFGAFQTKFKENFPKAASAWRAAAAAGDKAQAAAADANIQQLATDLGAFAAQILTIAKGG